MVQPEDPQRLEVREAGLDCESPRGSQPLSGPWGPCPQVLMNPLHPTGSTLGQMATSLPISPTPSHRLPGAEYSLHSFNKCLLST